MRKEKEKQQGKTGARNRKEQGDDRALDALGTDELCPSCGEEITVVAALERDRLEIECRCGCSLAVA